MTTALPGPKITGQAAMAAAIADLRQAGVDDAPGDARRLFAAACGIAPDRVTLVAGDPLDRAAQARFAAMVAARRDRVPVSHLTGKRQFYGRNFAVSKDVLDPRPDTEALIIAALQEPFGRVLDLGAGSGCILLTLLAETDATGVGTDLSDAALVIAARNAESLGLARRVRFHSGNWFDALPPAPFPEKFPLIVSNPPYIAANEMPGLAPEVRLHEPRMALTDGGDGLTHYAHIIAKAAAHLAQNGRLMFEIGPTQADAVARMLAAAGLADVTVMPDLDGRDRVIWARNPGK